MENQAAWTAHGIQRLPFPHSCKCRSNTPEWIEAVRQGKARQGKARTGNKRKRFHAGWSDADLAAPLKVFAMPTLKNCLGLAVLICLAAVATSKNEFQMEESEPLDPQQAKYRIPKVGPLCIDATSACTPSQNLQNNDCGPRHG